MLAYGALTVVIALAFCLLLVEVGLRVYSRLTPNVDVEFYRYASLMKGAAPGSGVGFRHAAGARERFFGVDVVTNSDGFRDVEMGPKEPGTRRIGLLGDSVTFGWGVAYGDRFSELLEVRLTEATGIPTELVNTGHGNYNTVQEYATLAESLADAELDAVLQVWYINDAEPTPPHRPAPWYARFHTAIFLWAKTDLLQRRFGVRESFEDYYRGLYREDAAGYRAFGEALDRTGAWARARDLPWMFVILPEFHSFDSQGPFRDVYAQVTARAAQAGARTLDATPAFAGTDPASVWVAYNDVHPNATGHAIIADAIAKELAARPLFGGSE